MKMKDHFQNRLKTVYLRCGFRVYKETCQIEIKNDRRICNASIPTVLKYPDMTRSNSLRSGCAFISNSKWRQDFEANSIIPFSPCPISIQIQLSFRNLEKSIGAHEYSNPAAQFPAFAQNSRNSAPWRSSPRRGAKSAFGTLHH